MKRLSSGTVLLFALFLAGLAAFVPLSVLVPRAPMLVEGDVFFENVTVIDVAAGKAIPDRTVVLKGDRIVAVLPAAEVAIPSGGTVIDGRGKFLIPGLWDMHAHILEQSYQSLFLNYGVTGVRHMFAPSGASVCVKPGEKDVAIYPRVVFANHILDGPGTAFKWPLADNVVIAKDADAARVGVRLIKQKGNDFLKVYSALSPEAYRAAVETAKQLGMLVAGHIPRSITVAEASDAGQHTVEHLEGVSFVCSKHEARYLAQLREPPKPGAGFDAATSWRIVLEAYESYDEEKGQALIAKFLKNGTWQVPTLIQTRQVARLADDNVLPADVEKIVPDLLRAAWKRKVTPDGVHVPTLGMKLTRADLRGRETLYRKDVEMLRRMHKAGVKILAGTDATTPLVMPGWSLHEELELLVADVGFTPAEALRAATLDPARCLKQDDKVGTIEPGKWADVVLLTKNPLDDIRHTRTVEKVLVGGRIVPK